MPFVPNPVTHTSSRLLEFETLRDLLAGYASSPSRPTPHRGTLAFARSRLDRNPAAAHLRNPRVSPRRRTFRIHGPARSQKLIEKSRICRCRPRNHRDPRHCPRCRPRFRVARNRPSASRRHALRLEAAVAALSAGIQDFTAFLRAFRNKILPDGTLDDRASPELSRVRREIEKQKRQIQESLRGYLRKLAEGGTVQDELITIRGERFVIPVKVEQKRRVQGVVHGASSSGQTVFVEPLETIEQNNELVRLLDEEQAEIHRVLLEMTRQIGENAEAILPPPSVLAELELQFAKARFAEDYNCVAVTLSQASHEQDSPGDGRLRPSMASEARLVLHRARHPSWNAI
jgi:DNA mismatch repair protein MutS2